MGSPARPPSRVPAPTVVPAPPAPEDLAPLLTTWGAGERFHRCLDLHWGARDFFAGDAAHRGRFHPLTPVGSTEPLPVLYGAGDFAGAVYETVFHDVPVRGIKRVPRSKLLRRAVVTLIPGRSLTLVDLTSEGLHRIQVSRGELIESDARSYPDTAAWARALHAHSEDIDGLLWVSRQHDTSRALVLFGDRVAVDDLAVDPDDVPLLLGIGRGLDLVSAAAARAGITITGLA